MKALNSEQLILPDWPAPQNITAFTTTRMGGFSQAPYDGLNMGFHVGDDVALLEKNYQQLQTTLGEQVNIPWMKQVHGVEVLKAEEVNSQVSEADAMYTQKTDQACAVLTADCLPVVLCNKAGTEIAVAHAGWKGLVAGIISKTIEQFDDEPENILVWLGPAIGQTAFEVGVEVQEKFVENFASFAPAPLIEQAFDVSKTHADKRFADLYALARIECLARGVKNIYGGGLCTYNDPRFYSYRRENITGRMATAIVRSS